MPRADYTDITVLLDRSGSMASIRSDMEGGFDTFVADQRRHPGECRLSLHQFDTEYERVYAGVPIADVPPLALVPRGGTALLDSVGRAVLETGERLRAMPEDQRPAAVLFVVITDGQENSSREFTKARVVEMVRHQTDVYRWQFVYVGANQDAFAEAGGIGIGPQAALQYAATGLGAAGAYSALSAGVKRRRSAAAAGVEENFEFTPEERKGAAGA